MADASVQLQISTLPQSPGVYQYYDKDEKLLYVGKAKNLKKRVASYFNKEHDNARTRLLVKKITKNAFFKTKFSQQKKLNIKGENVYGLINQ